MSASTSYDNLIAGTQKNIVVRPATITSGQAAFARGALLARVTASGKWVLAVHANLANYNDLGVATEAIDATAADVLTDAFVEGEFAERAVAFQAPDTADTWREDLAASGIYLRKSISVGGQ